MNSTESINTIVNTLTVCAEELGDIVPLVYEKFFATSADGRRLMGHSDQYMQGRMFEQVLELLMSDEHFESGGYLDWELANHLDAYQATPAMYRDFFDAVLDTVREGTKAVWSDQDADAWRFRIDQILKRVNDHGVTATAL